MYELKNTHIDPMAVLAENKSRIKKNWSLLARSVHSVFVFIVFVAYSMQISIPKWDAASLRVHRLASVVQLSNFHIHEMEIHVYADIIPNHVCNDGLGSLISSHINALHADLNTCSSIQIFYIRCIALLPWMSIVFWVAPSAVS